jgi:phosphate transport system substrate-binding protein
VRLSLSILLAVLLTGSLILSAIAGNSLTADYQGTLKIGGTGAALGTIAQVAAAFQKKHPGVRFVIPPSLGSTGGIKAVIAGALDLGLSSRRLTESERRQGAMALEYGRSPLLLVTSHKDTGVNFTLKQVAALYAGEARNFPDGTHMRIIIRPEHDADTLLVRSFSPEMDQAVQEALSRKGMIVAVTDQDNAEALEKINGAIGWMSLAQLITEKRSVNPLPLDTINPTQENFASGRYPFYKSFFVVTRGQPTPMAESFIQFLTSAEGREILLKTGHVAEMKKP